MLHAGMSSLVTPLVKPEHRNPGCTLCSTTSVHSGMNRDVTVTLMLLEDQDALRPGPYEIRSSRLRTVSL